MTNWTVADIPSQSGKLAVITGATGGLGYETSLALAQAGAEVILAGRNADKGRQAIQRIREQLPSAKVQFEKVDLGSLASVADFSNRMLARGRAIDLLINNAGVMTPPVRKTTDDGFELQFGTNHLDHFALTGRLLPLLRRSCRPRVVTVSSLTHRIGGEIHFDDLQWTRGPSAVKSVIWRTTWAPSFSFATRAALNSPRQGKLFSIMLRLALIQVDAAGEAARRAAKPSKPTLAVGFLTGQEIDWLPEVMRVLRDELPKIEVTVSSHSLSRELGDPLMRGKLDVAFLRAELKSADLIYKVVTSEPLVVILPSDHRLASRDIIDPKEIAGERLLSVSAASVLRAVIDDYLKSCGIDTKPELEADNLAMAMSLIASTRSAALLPAYVQNFLPWSVISRPLAGDVPTVDLVVGYNKLNTSPILKLFLSRIDDLIARVSSARPATQA